MDRLTVSGGVRLDFLNKSTEPIHARAAPLAAQPQQLYFAAVENVPNWKDINPRVSVAYDLFGNGKTALKASASRGVEQDSIRYAAANNPAQHARHAGRAACGTTRTTTSCPTATC